MFTADIALDLRRPPDLTPLHLSPDGAKLAVCSRNNRRNFSPGQGLPFTPDGMPDGFLNSRVHVVDTATGEAEEPFPPEGESWGARWSPDGNKLAAYVRTRGGPRLAIWDRVEGSSRTFPRAPVRPFFGFEVPRWTPDGGSVVVKLKPSREPEEPYAAGTGKSSPGVTVYSFDPASGDQSPSLPGWSEVFRCDLALVNVETGEANTLAEGWSLVGWKVSPDGRAVAVLRDSSYDLESDDFLFDLTIVSLDGPQPVVVAPRVPQEYGACFNWSPDGRRLAYVSQAHGEPLRLFVVSSDGTDGPVELTGEEGLDPERDCLLGETYFESPRWSADGKRVYYPTIFGCLEFEANGSGRRRIEVRTEKKITGWNQAHESARRRTRRRYCRGVRGDGEGLG